jgi:hypothetical protein
VVNKAVASKVVDRVVVNKAVASKVVDKVGAVNKGVVKDNRRKNAARLVAQVWHY